MSRVIYASACLALALGACQGTGDWRTMATGTDEGLEGIWGTGPNDVWVVGRNGTIIHWDGSAWTPFDSGSSALLWEVWGSGPSDVWAVGTEATLLHWDGGTWSAVDPGYDAGTNTFPHVTGTRPGDVYVVTGVASSSVDYLHWDGASWSVVDTMCPNFPDTLWVDADSNDAWLLVTDGPCHREGAGWTPYNIDYPGVVIWEDIWGSGFGDAWVVGAAIGAAFSADLAAHWDGAAWTLRDNLPNEWHINAISGNGPDDVWAVGWWGEVLHWNGAAWDIERPWRGGERILNDVWVSGPEVWAAGDFGDVVVRRTP